MEKFLDKVAKYMLAKQGHNMENVLVLMPNRRSCLYLSNALRNYSSQVIWSPDITTLQDWIAANSELALIEPIEQLMELYGLYKERGGADTLEEFVSTAQVMLNDFNEVDMHLVAPKSFFYDLEQLQSMKVYEPGGEPSEYTIRYRKFWKQFSELYFALREHLVAKGKAYTGMIYRSVAENIERIMDGNQPDALYIVGFSGLSKSEEKIIKTLKQLYQAEIIWDTDKYYVADHSHEAGFFFRKYKKEWRLDDKPWQNDLIATAAKKINVIGVAKNIGQTKVAADILANKLNIGESDERETVVIVPDENLLPPLLGVLPGNIKCLNISMGYPVKQSAIAELFTAIFSLHDNVERFNKKSRDIRFYYADVFALLHHPYSGYFLPDKAQVTTFVGHIRTRNRMVVGLKELQNQFEGTPFNKLFWYEADVNRYLARLLDLLDFLKAGFFELLKNENAEITVDAELLMAAKNIVQQVQNFVAVGNSISSVQSVRKLIAEQMRVARIPFEGEPVQGLQVMGMLETRSLDFKNVIILSMNEGIFPTGKTANSYIPYELRKAYMDTYAEKDALTAYLFYRLLHHAENVYLLYNTESDELGGGEKSRYILQLEYELKQANPLADIRDMVYTVDSAPNTPDDTIRIIKDNPLLDILRVNLVSEHGMSPSAINTYINCTLQYYFKYVAKLKEQEDIEESIEASTLGSAVHYVLENLYKPTMGRSLPTDFAAKAIVNKEKINALLKESFEQRFDADSLKTGKNYLLYRVCLKLINEFLKQEDRTLKLLKEEASEVKLIMLEKEMEHLVETKAGTVRVKGKVDRVEMCNGIISIADYKTGTPLGSVIKSDDIALFSTDPKYAKAMQLLTYAWLYWRSNNSPDIQLRTGIYWLREIGKGFDPLKADGKDVINKELLLQFEAVLKNVLNELLDPAVPFTKTEHVERCSHCEFVRICRRD